MHVDPWTRNGEVLFAMRCHKLRQCHGAWRVRKLVEAAVSWNQKLGDPTDLSGTKSGAGKQSNK